MSARLQPSAPTVSRQALAADPGLSAFVMANAGSGKTTVLVNRVLRLLLANVPPSRILCLTYTRAAAANMKLRVFKALGLWASCTDEALAGRLKELLGETADSAMMARARTLFATALETPGGLSIGTIHSFCERVLHSAPFEADVPADFNIIQGAELKEAISAAIRATLVAAARDPSSPLGQAMARIAAEAEETRFAELIDAVIAERDALRDAQGHPLSPERLASRLVAALGIEPDENADVIAGRFAASFEQANRCRDILDPLLASSPNDQKQGVRARAAALADSDEAAFSAFKDVVFSGDGKRRDRLVTAGFVQKNPEMAQRLADLADLHESLWPRYLAALTFSRSLALGRVAHDILSRLDATKRERRALDFADIIGRAQALLGRISAAWVLYKLDSGIDHVLIDEAQDTSAQQWEIIRRLTSEFFAGESARNAKRTVFAVGDVKQSIFSFQKAEPAAFAESLTHFERQARQASDGGHRFERIALTQSFRSTREIMAGVDLIFAEKARHRGLVFDGADRPEPHDTARTDGVGAIDIWPVDASDPQPERRGWDPAPVDSPSTAQQKLAARIARVLKAWTDGGRDDLGRPFRPGDALILMRKRDALFELIVRELKQARVPVAGVDRLDLSRHIAVDDIRAIGRAAILPEDDLALATALKTPILGLTDEDLLRLAPDRAGSLRAALAADPACAAAHARLSGLEARARSQGPFAFYAQLLGPEGGRYAMLARLGPEAGDALDAVLIEALGFEQREGPSLIGFIEALSSGEELKRDLAEEAGEVRVMTVHGAKGLEAPVVFIPDLGAPNRQAGRKTLHLRPITEGNMTAHAPLWTPRKSLAAPAAVAAAATHDAAQEDERRRLFYVALTRAADRLILCGANAKGVAPDGSWHAMAEEALAPHLAEAPHPDAGEKPIRRFRLTPAGEAAATDGAQEPLALPAHVPDWALRPAASLAARAAPRAPSSLGGASRHAMEAGEAGSGRLQAGLLAHRLLQYLPDMAGEARERAAQALAALHGAGLSGEERACVVARVLALMEEPALAALFGPGSVAEASVAGEIALASGPLAIAGRIDRLLVSADEVLIADYKSGRAPAAPDGVRGSALVQIAAYRRLLAEIYPGRNVRAAIIYLADGALVEPGPDALEAALAGL